MSFLSYKDVQRLAMCCRAFRELSALEFERRKNGTSIHFFLFRSKNLKTQSVILHPKSGASATIHMGVECSQQEVAKKLDQLNFPPKIAFIFTGNANSQDHQSSSLWFRMRMPKNCIIMNVLSKTAICGSISDHVYEVHQDRNKGTHGLGYLLLGTPTDFNVTVFRSLKELISLTDRKSSEDQPVKALLYFTKIHSRKNLASILSISKERNNDLSIAFGGLIIDSLASFFSDAYTSKIECAGLVFTGSGVSAASTIIEDMNDNQIRDSMIRFRDSIQFDINDRTKTTICFLLTCIEHSPFMECGSEYTQSESDIFHTIFPSNVKAFGLSGHGEFGQVSGLTEEQKKIAHQFSCVLVLVQFPTK